jgi:hypothetical protein
VSHAIVYRGAMIYAVAIGPDNTVYSTLRSAGETAIVRHTAQGASIAYETSDPLHGLWISPRGTIHAAGKKLHDNARGTFASVKHAVGECYALWGADDDHVYVGGDAGLQLRRGDTWTEVAVDDAGIFALGGTGADDVYAGGDDGVLRHFDGVKWRKLKLKGTSFIQGIACASRDEVLVITVAGDYQVFRGNARDGFKVIEKGDDEAYGVAPGPTVHAGWKLFRGGQEAAEVDPKRLMVKSGEFSTAMTSRGSRIVAGGISSVLVDDGRGFVAWPGPGETKPKAQPRPRKRASRTAS